MNHPQNNESYHGENVTSDPPTVQIEFGSCRIVDDGSNNSNETENSDSWSVQPWHHAFYHTTTSVLGVTALLVLPSAYAYLGWAGGTILLVVSTLVSYYSGSLIICLQKPEHRTYSDIANSVMENPRFAAIYIRPLQGLLFCQITIISTLITGQSMQSIANLAGESMIPQYGWVLVAGAVMFALALIPSMAQLWQVSLVGTITAILGAIFLTIGTGLAISQGSSENASYGRPPPASDNVDPNFDFAMGVLDAFGILAFAYGGHAVLPDVQASLHDHDAEDSRLAMMKGLNAAYFIIFPAYVLITSVGYAAFGVDVSSSLLDNLQNHVSDGFVIFLYILVIMNGIALGQVYVQAGFTLMNDIFPSLGDSYNGRYNFKEVVARFTLVGFCTFVAIAIPFFGYLSALVGAICFTPLTVSVGTRPGPPAAWCRFILTRLFRPSL